MTTYLLSLFKVGFCVYGHNGMEGEDTCKNNTCEKEGEDINGQCKVGENQDS